MVFPPWLRRRFAPHIHDADIFRAFQGGDYVWLVPIVVIDQGHISCAFDHRATGINLIRKGVVTWPVPPRPPNEVFFNRVQTIAQMAVI